MLKSVFSKLLALAGSLVLLLSAGRAGASENTQHSVRQLLSEHFKNSDRVTYVKVHLDAQQRTHIEQRLGGRQLSKDDFIFYVASSSRGIDGYALFDEERGQHELISFATFFDASGHITRVEVVTYREPYGDGIRADRFRRQFVGRSSQSGFAPGRDIDTISGATISSRSMCVGVQRASVLLEETLLRDNPVLAKR